ncbi:g7727 [Coccomyxa viridis]|uniref:G7727 protein n=1 Tax=Coccomyxa viridis TaxID=1274662 RepID=A0ABP1FYL9_9CHLO
MDKQRDDPKYMPTSSGKERKGDTGDGAERGQMLSDSRDYSSSSTEDGRKRKKEKDKKRKKEKKDKAHKVKKSKPSKSEKKQKSRERDRERGPVQLSKHLAEDGEQYSVISGKKINLKVKKTAEDIEAERRRADLLMSLNAFYE